MTDRPRPTRVVLATRPDGRVRLDLHAGPLAPRVIERDGTAAEVALVSGGALLLGGDRVDLEIEVGAGCHLDLVDIGGTVAYDGEGRKARWNARITIGPGAHLSWSSLPFVVSTGADVLRRTEVTLAEGATLQLRETLVLGRSGEDGGTLVTTTVVTGPDGPILVEELGLDGAHGVPGVAQGYRVIDSVLVAGRRAPGGARDPHDGERRDPASEEALVLDLEEPGTLARWLGRETHLSPIDTVWNTWRHKPGEPPAGEPHDLVRPDDSHDAPRSPGLVRDGGVDPLAGVVDGAVGPGARG